MWPRELQERFGWHFDAEGGGSGGGATATTEGGGKSSKAEDGDKAPDLSALRGDMNNLNMSITELVNLAKAAQTNQGSGASSATTAVEEPEDDPTDLEVMSRADFAKHMVDKVLTAINKQLVPNLQAQIAEIKQSTTRHQLAGAVEEMKSKHKDFMDWRTEMIQLAKEHPGLPPHRLYGLARLENPGKAGDLDKKYNPQPTDAGGKKSVRLSFGGLTPSQSGTGSRGQKMGTTEASNAAWADTVAALGGEPLFGEE